MGLFRLGICASPLLLTNECLRYDDFNNPCSSLCEAPKHLGTAEGYTRYPYYRTAEVPWHRCAAADVDAGVRLEWCEADLLQMVAYYPQTNSDGSVEDYKGSSSSFMTRVIPSSAVVSKPGSIFT